VFVYTPASGRPQRVGARRSDESSLKTREERASASQVAGCPFALLPATLCCLARIGEVGKTYHVISSPRVTLAGDTASSTVMWTVIARNPDETPLLTMVGHHVDTLVRVDGRWLFQRRKGVVHIPNVLAK